MADKTKIAGVAGKTVAVQLKPVNYQISLHYLGHDRIKHEKDTYRCRYELQKEAAVAKPASGAARSDPALTLITAPTVIPNVVRETPESDPKAKPALPSAKKGDSTNPDPDEVYRILIVDNHGTKEPDNLPVLRGEKTKQQTYGANKWMPDIQPAVPFRVVVRKFVGDTPATLEANLELIVEIKDPVEEFDQTDGQRQVFMNGFFNKYNRADTDPDPGDDNAVKKFAGIRAPSASYAGAKATDVLKKVAYAKPPVVAEAGGNPGAIPFANLGAAAALGTNRATFAVTTVAETGSPDTKVGVADFVFTPPPTGGDNYRFLLSIRGALEKGKTDKADPREQKLNGAKAKLLDDAKKEIKDACSYVTGRFVIWRKTQFRMLVNCNGRTAAGIAFDSMAATYRKSFIVLEPPVHTFDVDWKVWRDALKECYAGDGDPWFDDTNEANLRSAFADGFIPGDWDDAAKVNFKFRFGGATSYAFSRANITTLTKYLVKRSCTDPAVKLTNPAGHGQITFDKPDSDGFFVMFAKRSLMTGSLLGAYFGDRMFYMFETTVDDTTFTCAHELGHALGLSHSLTANAAFDWNASGGTSVAVMEASSNCRIHDHDQDDAANCLMSYIAGGALTIYPYHPCGACALALRFYNKAEFQKPEHYGSDMMQQLDPAAIVFLDSVNTVLKVAIPSIGVNQEKPLIAVGKEVDWPSTTTTTFKARVGLSSLATLTFAGVAPNAGTASVTGTDRFQGVVYYKVKGLTAGRVEARFSHNGLEAKAQFDVVP